MKRCAAPLQFLALALAVLLSACAGGSSQLKSCQEGLSAAEAKLAAEEGRTKALREEIARKDTLINALERERGSKDASLTATRKVTREYLRGQLDRSLEMATREEILDFVGGELVPRPERHSGKGATLLMAGAEMTGGVVSSVKGYFADSTSFSVLLFRKGATGYLPVWESEIFTVKELGLRTIPLSPPIVVRKGDLVGFHFPEKAGVGYDEVEPQKGSSVQAGLFTWLPERGEQGKAVALPKGDRRNYSIGVAGIFE